MNDNERMIKNKNTKERAINGKNNETFKNSVIQRRKWKESNYTIMLFLWI